MEIGTYIILLASILRSYKQLFFYVISRSEYNRSRGDQKNGFDNN